MHRLPQRELIKLEEGRRRRWNLPRTRGRLEKDHGYSFRPAAPAHCVENNYLIMETSSDSVPNKIMSTEHHEGEDKSDLRHEFEESSRAFRKDYRKKKRETDIRLEREEFKAMKCKFIESLEALKEEFNKEILMAQFQPLEKKFTAFMCKSMKIRNTFNENFKKMKWIASFQCEQEEFKALDSLFEKTYKDFEKEFKQKKVNEEEMAEVWKQIVARLNASYQQGSKKNPQNSYEAEKVQKMIECQTKPVAKKINLDLSVNLEEPRKEGATTTLSNTCHRVGQMERVLPTSTSSQVENASSYTKNPQNSYEAEKVQKMIECQTKPIAKKIKLDLSANLEEPRKEGATTTLSDTCHRVGQMDCVLPTSTSSQVENTSSYTKSPEVKPEQEKSVPPGKKKSILNLLLSARQADSVTKTAQVINSGSQIQCPTSYSIYGNMSQGASPSTSSQISCQSQQQTGVIRHQCPNDRGPIRCLGSGTPSSSSSTAEIKNPTKNLETRRVRPQQHSGVIGHQYPHEQGPLVVPVSSGSAASSSSSTSGRYYPMTNSKPRKVCPQYYPRMVRHQFPYHPRNSFPLKGNLSGSLRQSHHSGYQQYSGQHRITPCPNISHVSSQKQQNQSIGVRAQEVSVTPRKEKSTSSTAQVALNPSILPENVYSRYQNKYPPSGYANHGKMTLQQNHMPPLSPLLQTYNQYHQHSGVASHQCPSNQKTLFSHNQNPSLSNSYNSGNQQYTGNQRQTLGTHLSTVRFQEQQNQFAEVKGMHAKRESTISAQETSTSCSSASQPQHLLRGYCFPNNLTPQTNQVPLRFPSPQPYYQSQWPNEVTSYPFHQRAPASYRRNGSGQPTGQEIPRHENPTGLQFSPYQLQSRPPWHSHYSYPQHNLIQWQNLLSHYYNAHFHGQQNQPGPSGISTADENKVDNNENP